MNGVASGQSQATNFILVSIKPETKWTLRGRQVEAGNHQTSPSRRLQAARAFARARAYRFSFCDSISVNSAISSPIASVEILGSGLALSLKAQSHSYPACQC